MIYLHYKYTKTLYLHVLSKSIQLEYNKNYGNTKLKLCGLGWIRKINITKSINILNLKISIICKKCLMILISSVCQTNSSILKQKNKKTKKLNKHYNFFTKQYFTKQIYILSIYASL